MLELGRSHSVRRHGGPVVESPQNVLVGSLVNHRLDGECVSGLHVSWSLVLGVVRDTPIADSTYVGAQ